MGQSPEHTAYELGYHFSQKPYPHAAGYRRLDIAIAGIPSDQHFDPSDVQLFVFSSVNGQEHTRMEHLKIFHPWSFKSSYRVAPGMIIISDRKDKKVEAFTLGGMLHIAAEDKHTRCVIESEAPIIEMDPTKSTVMALVEEVEVILAKRRAIWAHHEETFETRLAKISPSALYTSCIEALIGQLVQDFGHDMSTVEDLYQFIVAEKKSLVTEGLWPESIPPFSESL